MKVELREWQIALNEKYKSKVTQDLWMCRCKGCFKECSREETRWAIIEEHISLDSTYGLCEKCLVSIKR